MRSPNEGRGAGAKDWLVGASICGITGASIFGGGGGGGNGGLNCDPPGGMNCAEAAFANTSAAKTAEMMTDPGFMADMS